ncbi:MAG: RNA 2',3'-cyclic phosphodiesterase [DPANN group archaeon]|nr:RNA 2',3'-cyclic phosphodiesterase [DPANN group archaeon]
MRTFVAIEIPAEVKKTVSETITDAKKVNLIEGNFVKVEQSHLTLKFLGEVQEKDVEKVGFVLEELSKTTKKFQVELKGLGHFDEKILWIGSPENKDIVNLANKIDEKLSKLGFAKETRPFAIHLTLCRIKNLKNSRKFAEFIAKYKDKSFGKFLVNEIKLMKSTLTEEGSIYEEIRSFKLF